MENWNFKSSSNYLTYGKMSKTRSDLTIRANEVGVQRYTSKCKSCKIKFKRNLHFQ